MAWLFLLDYYVLSHVWYYRQNAECLMHRCMVVSQRAQRLDTTVLSNNYSMMYAKSSSIMEATDGFYYYIWTIHFHNICSELLTNSPHSDRLICITWSFRLSSWVISCLAMMQRGTLLQLSPVMKISQGAIQALLFVQLSMIQGSETEHWLLWVCGTREQQNSYYNRFPYHRSAEEEPCKKSV